MASCRIIHAQLPLSLAAFASMGQFFNLIAFHTWYRLGRQGRQFHGRHKSDVYDTKRILRLTRFFEERE